MCVLHIVIGNIFIVLHILFVVLQYEFTLMTDKKHKILLRSESFYIVGKLVV